MTNCDSCERVEDLEIELAKWRDDRHYPGELRKCFERVRDAVGSAENDCTAAADIAVARIASAESDRHSIRYELLDYTPDDNPDAPTVELASEARRTLRELIAARDLCKVLLSCSRGEGVIPQVLPKWLEVEEK